MTKKAFAVVRLNGGLGNQLFQLAAAKLCEERFEQAVRLDEMGLLVLQKRRLSTPRVNELADLERPPGIVTSEELANLGFLARIFRNQSRDPLSTLASQVLTNILGSQLSEFGLLVDGNVDLLNEVIDPEKTTYLMGYWADHRIPDQLGDVLREFILAGQVGIPEISEEIRDKEATVVHVRRGDFVGIASRQHDILPVDYHLRSLEAINRTSHPAVVFSDDINWCKQTFSQNRHFTFVEVDPRYSALDYLVTMSSASHFVIPNSSYSWWAAWLSMSEGKQVVRPSSWVRDPGPEVANVYPPNWLNFDEIAS